MRFGLLGTGHWAVETQGAALVAHASADLVGVWGRDPAKAKSVADRFGATAYPDVDALLADVDAAERERLAEKVFRHQESLRAAVAAIDNYDQLKRCMR